MNSPQISCRLQLFWGSQSVTTAHSKCNLSKPGPPIQPSLCLGSTTSRGRLVTLRGSRYSATMELAPNPIPYMVVQPYFHNGTISGPSGIVRLLSKMGFKGSRPALFLPTTSVAHALQPTLILRCMYLYMYIHTNTYTCMHIYKKCAQAFSGI